MPITFKRHTLANGLRVIVHEDHTTQLAACNVLYNVGSRDENPLHTGIAHLFEHYMFCGSKHIPDYDTPLQKIGAYNNAYTSQDHTHYYIVLPAQNLETALWIESDRMLELAFEQYSLDTQKKVVIEEFKETCLNRPFGDAWASFNKLIYSKYPYQWMPIGKKISHIETVTMEMMKGFFFRFYRPDNAILVIGGHVHFDEVIPLVEKWFSDIQPGNAANKHFPTEPTQRKAKFLELKNNVPYSILLKGWKMPQRLHPDFYTFDLLSDLLGTGKSSYLYQKFVTKEQLFTDISLAVTGTAGPGTLALEARPANGIDIHEANQRLSDFLYNEFQFPNTLAHDLQKVKNRNESVILNNEIKLDSRTSILAVEESISKIEDFENDIATYQKVTEDDVKRVFNQAVTYNRENTLFYSPLK